MNLMERNKVEKSEKVVMMIVAHPDDAEFSSAGTVAKWAAEGRLIYYLLATAGDKGSSDPRMTRQKLAKIRRQEQRSAAKILGVKEVFFLNEYDGELQNTPALREKIVRYLRRYRPDVVITLDPTTYIRRNLSGKYDYISHSDHRVIGEAALDAIYPSARDHLYFPHHKEEGLSPHKVKEIYLAMSEKPNFWVDISSTLDLKIRALSQHYSQVGVDINKPKRQVELKKRIAAYAARTGKREGLKLAESFRRLKLQP